MQHKLAPWGVAHQWCTLGHAIAHGKGELYLIKEFLDLGVEWCATNNHLFKLTAECLDETLTNAVVDLAVEIRHCECPAQLGLANHGHNHLAVDFLKHQWHAYNKVRLYLLHCLHYDLGGRDATKQCDVRANG